jgi:hypothetical protein
MARERHLSEVAKLTHQPTKLSSLAMMTGLRTSLPLVAYCHVCPNKLAFDYSYSDNHIIEIYAKYTQNSKSSLFNLTSRQISI